MSDILCLEKKLYHQLSSVSTTTREMSDALGRSDQVSLSMLISMRQDPLLRLEEIKANVESALLSLPEEDAIRTYALLHGAEPIAEDEVQLCEQVSANRRLLNSIIALDRELSLRMDGRNSIYARYLD